MEDVKIHDESKNQADSFTIALILSRSVHIYMNSSSVYICVC